jgi:hypothetical protein
MVVIPKRYNKNAGIKCGVGMGGQVEAAMSPWPHRNSILYLTRQRNKKQDTQVPNYLELAVIELAQVCLNLPDYKRRYLFAMNFSWSKSKSAVLRAC